MPDEPTTPEPSVFADVLADELKLIRSRREEILREELARRAAIVTPGGGAPSYSNPPDADADSRLKRVRLEALDEHLAGLTFSGGGIRAGTFAVGLLQGMSSLGMLRRFDYLSTVSGGGYAGGWLASWLKRDGDVRNVERQLDPSRVSQAEAWRDRLNPPPPASSPAASYPTTHSPSKGLVVDEEPEPIYHLRSYSSYMAPQLGLLTADTWTIIGIWFRNVTVNLLMFLPLGAALVLVARIILALYGSLTTESIGPSESTQVVSVIPLQLGLLMLFVAFAFNGRALREFRREGAGRPPVDEAKAVYWRWLYPLLIAAFFLSLSLRPVMWGIGNVVKAMGDDQKRTEAAAPPGLEKVPLLKVVGNWLSDQFGDDLGLLGVPNVFGHAVVLGLAFMFGAFVLSVGNRTLWKIDKKKYYGIYVVGAVLVLAIGLLALSLIGAQLVAQLSPGSSPAWLLAWVGAAIVSLLILLGLVLATVRSELPLPQKVVAGLLALIAFDASLLFVGGKIAGLLKDPGLLLDPNGLLNIAAMVKHPGGFPVVVILTGLAIVCLVIVGIVAFALLGRRQFRWKFLTAALIAGASGGVLLAVAEYALTALSDAGHPELVAMLATPMLLVVLLLSLIVEVALLGRSVTEASREWWSRIGALVTIGLILWISTFAIIIYVPALFIGAGLPLRLVITSTWVGTLVAGVLAGRNARPADKGGGGFLATFAAIAPPVFMIGILGAISLLVSGQINDPSVAFPPQGGEWPAIAHYFDGLRGAGLPSMIFWLGLSLVLAWIGSSLIDVNLFSLNAMYANRLIRCYLGASRPKKAWKDRWGGRHRPRGLSGAPIQTSKAERDQNPATGFDPKDDIDLLDLRIGYVNPDRPEDRKYWGPHLLINTSLNLVGGEELAWRDRKGESFTLSPLYCGSKGTGYARVEKETRKNGLTLGRAMSISGAAVDPNMRFYQSAALTAFLTLMNARLGYWMENPAIPADKDSNKWAADSPKFANLLVDEFLGQTVGTGPFVHLSDGGHFENMGVYELIRRRCRYVVACDAGEDTGASDDNLGILTRLVRIDFGVRIVLETEPFQLRGDDKNCQAHVIVGTIHYEDVDGGEEPGIIVYVRISMTGDEPADIQQYAKSAPGFPHQPTDLKQSFSEEQFESYRALGDHIARKVFGIPSEDQPIGDQASYSFPRDRPFHRKKVNDVPTGALLSLWTRSNPHDEFVEGNRRLFEELCERWKPKDEKKQTPEKK